MRFCLQAKHYSASLFTTPSILSQIDHNATRRGMSTPLKKLESVAPDLSATNSPHAFDLFHDAEDFVDLG